jgi:serine/threonine protein phosphatase PrpC
VAWLTGDAHPALGQVAAASASRRLGIALSAGARSKPYPHVDPNEDACLVAVRPWGDVLCVVDGHGGFAAARAALEAVAVLAEGTQPRRVEELFLAAREATARAGHGSDTAVSVAVVRDGTLAARTVGDTAVLVVRPDGHIRVASGVAPHLDHAPALPGPPHQPLPHGAAVVLASDGFFDACNRSWPALVAAALRDHQDAEAAAGALVAEALRLGADDNIAVALVRHRQLLPDAGFRSDRGT